MSLALYYPSSRGRLTKVKCAQGPKDKVSAIMMNECS